MFLWSSYNFIETFIKVGNYKPKNQISSTSFGQIILAPNIFTSSNSFEQPRGALKNFRRLRTTSNVLDEFRRASKSFEELRSVEQLQTASNNLGDFRSCEQLRAGCLGGILDRDHTHTKRDRTRCHQTESDKIWRYRMTADNNIGGIGLSDGIGRDLTRSDSTCRLWF